MKIIKENYFSVVQTIGEFYVCKMTPKSLKEISKKDISRYENMSEIQRELRGERTREIREYIYGKKYATFPNSFIVSVDNDSFIDNEGNLNLEGEAYILDGQHRLSGFKEDEIGFEIIVSVFIGLDKFHQAMIFSNINGEQMKVNKSLVYSLYGFGEKRTVELIAYSLISLLNRTKTSPWFEGIKILGKGDGVLSLAPFFEKLKDEIEKGVFKSYYKNDGAEFNGLFDTDEKLYFILEDYFNAVRNVFSEEWGNKDFILTKTTGFYAFFDLLIYIFREKIIDGEFTAKSFEDIIMESKKGIKERLTSNSYESGGKGQKKLYNELIEYLNKYK